MITVLINKHIKGGEKRIHYVLDFIEKHPLAKGRLTFTQDKDTAFDLQLTYGHKQPNTFYIPAQEIIFSKQIPEFDQLVSNSYSVKGQSLYSVEIQENPPQPFLIGQDFQFDIIETMFFYISRFEEWHYSEGRKDVHGRMSSKYQFLVKNGLYQKPVVDELVFCFLNAIGIKTQEVKTQIRITHDIDFVIRKNTFWSIFRSFAGYILKRKNPKAAYLVWKNRHEKNPFDTFEWMLRKEDNIEKVIYFLVGGKAKLDNQYDLDLPVVKKAFQLSKERNYQLGIHPSYESWKDIQIFQGEREKLENHLGESLQLTRQHFLRFSFPLTAKIIDDLELKEDSSLGYADLIGFRCGTGFSYHLYDFEKERAYKFLETPLVVMDSALFKQGNHQAETIKEIWYQFLKENQFNTKITFNFHNSWFYEARVQGIPLRELYKELFEKYIP